MSLDSIALLSKLETDLAHTAAKIYRADSADFNEIAQCFIDKLVRTPAVVRPRTADDVALVVQFCLRNKADFTVRFGGYDCAGRTRVDEALVIDMRDLNEVSISEDKCSATVGGGILHGQLARALGEEELATPVVHRMEHARRLWPVIIRLRLGVAQILGVNIANAQGEIQTASEELLPLDKVRDRIKGKTGVDFLLTRGYNFSQILSSTILYESSNLEATITTYNQHYGHLRVAEELTDCLPLQPTITQIPNMRTVFGVIVTWYGENKEEGYAWIEIFAKGVLVSWKLCKKLHLQKC
uniref:FAD-binding PCMH-type domain-containing protein n=1 Tax=Bionectria ochroleuca TaxID=29856 RepID=A0A8H7N2C3_BIOOC